MPIRFKVRLRIAYWVLIGCIGLAAWPHLVQAKKDPPTLVTLAPHLTELAFTAGAGAQVVGVVAYSHWPEDALELPRIGDAFRFDMEAIVSLDPDMALAWRGGTPPEVAEQLQGLGVEVVWIETQTLDQIKTAIEHIGRAAGTAQRAEAQAKAYAEALAQWQNRAPPNSTAEPVRVFYQIAARPLYTFGGRHVINEVFASCDAVNVFGHVDSEALSVDPESVLAAKPDMIVSGHEPNVSGPPVAPFEVWTPHLDGALAQTTLSVVDPNLLVRPTPRILQGIERLCALVQNHRDAP